MSVSNAIVVLDYQEIYLNFIQKQPYIPLNIIKCCKNIGTKYNWSDFVWFVKKSGFEEDIKHILSLFLSL